MDVAFAAVWHTVADGNTAVLLPYATAPPLGSPVILSPSGGALGYYQM